MSFTKVDGTITLVPSEQRQFTDMPIQIKNGKETSAPLAVSPATSAYYNI